MFGTYKCGRMRYAVIILAVMAFDFAKTPIEQALGGAYDSAMQSFTPEVDANRAPGSFSDLQGEMDRRQTSGKTEGKPHPLASLSPQELAALRADAARLKQIHRSGGPSNAEEKALEQRVLTSSRDIISNAREENPKRMPLMVDSDFLAKATQLTAKQAVANTSYITAIWAIGFLSLFAVAWALFARLRDIGWKSAVGVAVIGLFLVKLWTASFVPYAITASMQYLFFLCLIALAFVPSGFGEGPSQPPARRRVAATAVTPSGAKPLFGPGSR